MHPQGKSKLTARWYADEDAALGVLIPYIQPTYDVGLLQVSMIYLVNFMGWLVACFANIHVCSYLGTGGTLVLGASIQCFGYALMFWSPPFPLFMAAFFFSGCGVAFQDAQMNTFTITVKDAHRWLGVLHAVYGVGTIVGPLIANTIASRMPVWHHYYLVTMFLAALNIASLAWTFRKGLFRPNVGSTKETAGKELRDTVANWTVWIFNGFFFLYVGAEVTAGGMVFPKTEGAPPLMCFRLARPVSRFGEKRRSQEGRLHRLGLLDRLHPRPGRFSRHYASPG